MKKTLALLVLASFTAFGCSSKDDDTDQITHDDCLAADSGTEGGPVTVPVDSSPGACTTAADCIVPSGPCFTCGDGSTSCPTADCVEGTCIVTMPSLCADDDGGADTDAAADAAAE